MRDIAKERNQLGLLTAYDRTCLEIPKSQSNDRALKGEAHVIRLKTPNITPVFQDIIYGKVGKTLQSETLQSQNEGRYEDPILIKSDGSPTYHLANVVDDHYMGITHVIRAVVSELSNFELSCILKLFI